MSKYNLYNTCKGCHELFLNSKGLKPSLFMNQKYCTKKCRIKNTNFSRNIKDYSGTIINNIQVIRQNGRTNAGIVRYDCRCYCGKIFNTIPSRLNSKRTRSCGCFQKKLLSQNSSSNIRDKHWNWNPNLTDEERIKKRDCKEIVYFRNDVYKRDNYTCQICKATRYLNAHHLDGWNWCKEKRYNIDNGITLCKTCHSDFHNLYGLGNNTKEQFNKYLEDKTL